MLVILATIVACIWYFFDLPSATTVVLVCGLIIVLSTIVNRNVKSVLFFLGTVILFFVALSNSIFYAAFAFFVVLIAAGILFDSASSEELDGERNNGRGFNNGRRIREPKTRVANARHEGFYGYDDEVQYDRNNSRFSHASSKKQSGMSEEEYRKKQAEDDAYFYRRHSGYRHKVDEADDILGRSQRDRDYEDDKYEVRCNGCNEPESHCKCCGTCDQYPCRCCRRCDSYPCECCNECGEANCRCCRRCDSYPCECCNECGEANCRCCRRCDSYPCECCNECGEANCRCCRRCESYPCECCNSCGQPDRYCRCDR
ncbi:hypothetical protein COE49_10340 [Bacillus sp. AFS029637]|nr:hypothetical protein COE49_10340 [Bacillus sp. AFS029637]